MSEKLVLVGADNHVTTLEMIKSSRRRRSTWFRWTCSCPYPPGKWYAWPPDAAVQAEVHARLHHGAHPDRGKWRNPNVEPG